MDVNNWEKVPCEITYQKFDPITNKWIPDEEFSIAMRKGKVSYRITGIVTKANSPELATSVGSTKSYYLHYDASGVKYGHIAIIIGSTRTDTGTSDLYPVK